MPRPCLPCRSRVGECLRVIDDLAGTISYNARVRTTLAGGIMRTSRLLPLCLVVAVGCTCGDKGKTPTDPLTPVGQDGTRQLDPLPKPPDLNVPQEALPGAKDELAVVAARPQGEQFGEVRPTVTFSRPVKSLEMVEAQRAEDAAAPFASISTFDSR
ncbi:MAG: hypothetical protein QM817_18670 [Archangium sp.]